MNGDNAASGLAQTWVPVTDGDGRTHLEAHWVDLTGTPAHVTHAA